MTGGKFWEIKYRNSSHRASPRAFVALLMLILSQPGGVDAGDFVAFSSFCYTIPVAGLLSAFSLPACCRASWMKALAIKKPACVCSQYADWLKPKTLNK